MYGWIWDRLPGNVALKSLCALVLVGAVGWLLWFKIFPWAEPLLPFGDVTVDGTTTGGSDTVDESNPASPPASEAPTTAGG
ncbi:hypothetical protein [Cryptosporangium minutisporangium]|uniref:Uncharacterized protein n=1 Tax=Cryptosporangium minutisporangium TaxID=113569 RepID=A0ABP6T5M6_9ACTN